MNNDTPTLEDIRSNPRVADEYTDQEREVLISHKDEWTDEEQWALSSILPDNQEIKEGEEAEVAIEEESTEDDIEEQEKSGDESATSQTSEPITFKSPEDLQTAIEKVISEREAAKPQQEQQTKQEQKEEARQTATNFFPEGYIPKDANEFASALYEKFAPLMVNNVKQVDQAEKQQLVELNRTWDTQYNELAKSGKVPELATPEGSEVNRQIALLSARYGIDNYHDGYELWAKTAKEHGGGYEIKQEIKRQAMTEQKKAASMVSKGSSAPAPSKAELPSWEKIHNTDLDTLIQEDL